MKKTISAGEARQKLGEVLEGVFYQGDEVVIQRAGKPMGVIVPARVYQNIVRDREHVFELIRQAQERNRNVPPEVLEREVAEEIRSYRREKQERENE